MEQKGKEMGGLRGGFLRSASIAARPFGWSASGLNRAAGQRLIEFAAEREKMTLPQGFEKWTADDQKAWINASNLSGKDLLTAGAKMGGNLEYADADLTKKIQEQAKAVFLKEDVSYQEEAKGIAKVYPEIMDENVRLYMKLFGKNGVARDRAKQEIEEDIKNTADFIEKSLSDEDLSIEAGLKLEYITKEGKDASGNDTYAWIDPSNKQKVIVPKDQAAQIMKNQITAGKRTKFLRDTAAGATYVREFKGADIGKMADTKTLSTRVGLALGNPSNIQRLVDEHGKSSLDDLVHGPGGLDSITNNQQKARRFFKESKGMFKALFNNPAMSHIDFEGKDLLLDPFDEKTMNLAAYERRQKILDMTEGDALLTDAYDKLKEERKLSRDIAEKQTRIKDLTDEIKRGNKIIGKSPISAPVRNATEQAVKSWEKEKEKLVSETDSQQSVVRRWKDEIRMTKENAAKTAPSLKAKLDEIERLASGRGGERQGRQRQNP